MGDPTLRVTNIGSENYSIREFEIGQIYVQISNSRVAACCCCRTFRGGLVREVG